VKASTMIAVMGVALACVACSDNPSSPGPMEPQLSVGNGSRCYAVEFNVEITSPDGSSFTAELSGGLEGTVEVVGTGFTWPPTGATNTSTQDYTFHITGGAVPELNGLTFSTSAENRNILYFLLPSGQQFVRNVGQHRVVAGVASANLTYIGQTGLTFPQVTSLDHRGVICP
jgi:hypothetical protein